jgi:hypothetical protein
MASERQTASNRRNATRSSGPQSWAGKKRASRNAYRHGLSLNISADPAWAKQLDDLAGKIAGDTKNVITLARARAVAEAELDLARARQSKVSLIERACAFGDLDARALFGSAIRAMRFLNAPGQGSLCKPERIARGASTRSREPDRSAEAIQRVLPVLAKLDRYERRASARRDRAVQALLGRKKSRYDF